MRLRRQVSPSPCFARSLTLPFIYFTDAVICPPWSNRKRRRLCSNVGLPRSPPAAGEQRKTTAPTTSSGRPHRFNGVRAKRAAVRAGSSCNSCVKGVAIHPGATAFTRMLSVAQAMARRPQSSWVRALRKASSYSKGHLPLDAWRYENGKNRGAQGQVRMVSRPTGSWNRRYPC
jgi:hypothetical protein